MQTEQTPAAVADGLATACERYTDAIDQLHSLPAGVPAYAEADAAVLAAIVALDDIARPAAEAARLELAQRRAAERALPPQPDWFEQESIGICAECVDTADVGERLQVPPLDDRDRCPGCAEAYRPTDAEAIPDFSPIAPPSQPISPATFYALHRAILAEQAARERRSDRNDWPIQAAATRSDAEQALIAADAAPFECEAAAVYADAVDAIGPPVRIAWTGAMDGLSIAAQPQQNESE